MARNFIYVPLGGGGGDGDAGALAAAQEAAGPYDAEPLAVFLGQDDAAVLMIAGDGFTGVGASAVEVVREQREAARGRAEAACRDAGVAMTLHTGPREHASGLARLAVLAVIDPAAARSSGPLADVFDALVLEDGAPVLVPRSAFPPRRVGVAWDGSRESARALKAAGPLLADAARVVVLQAPAGLDAKDAPCADPETAVDWIRRQGGKPEAARVDITGDAATTLLAAAEAEAVDLLVAGAWGHTRLREAVFGGVTRALLHADSPSLLLAH